MADPLSIITGCAGLIGGITTISARIANFVSSVRESRKDMQAVAYELVSLSLCLEALRNDCWSCKVEYPEAMQRQLQEILVNCDLVLQQIDDLLIKLSSGRLGRKIQCKST